MKKTEVNGIRKRPYRNLATSAHDLKHPSLQTYGPFSRRMTKPGKLMSFPKSGLNRNCGLSGSWHHFLHVQMFEYQTGVALNA